MKNRIYLSLVLVLIIGLKSFGQSTDIEYYFTANANLYLPINTPQKGVYPILWYDKTTDPKLLIGGFGVGVTALKSIKNKVSIKGQANISKHTYWDEPDLFTEDGIVGAAAITGSSDFTIGLTGTINYFISEKFLVGTGLGGQLLLVSLSRLPGLYGNESEIAVNKYYKPVMPVIPLEASLKLKKTMYSIRYEHALLNRLKSDLAQYKTDRYGLLTFEVGFHL